MSERWLFHALLRADLTAGDAYSPASLAREGFIHASYRDAVVESARLYFPSDADLVVLQIDPRKLGVRVEVAQTPRGPMPHIHGPIRAEAIHAVLQLSEVEAAPDGIAP